MELLELLAACLEQGRTAIALTLADGVEREHLERLQQLGAMMQSRAEAIICPCCEARSVRVMSAGSAFCSDCGQVNLRPQDLQRLTPDGDWLRRRIAQALDLAGESAWVMLPGRVWRIGDIGRASGRHRVLYGQQLADVMVQRALLTMWPTHVGDIPAVIITTSRIERVFLPGLHVQLVPLAAAFQVRGHGLVADEAVWAGMRAAMYRTTAPPRAGPFAHDFSDVLLPGDAEPIALTSAQAALLRILWEQRGMPVPRETLIARANVGVDKPVQAFQKQKYPEANRAYHALVCSDARGRYWIPRAQ
jgi:hypothetical protein